MENDRGPSTGKNKNSEEEKNEEEPKEKNIVKENEEEDKEHGAKNKARMGPCKPKATIIPRVTLNEPAL